MDLDSMKLQTWGSDYHMNEISLQIEERKRVSKRRAYWGGHLTILDSPPPPSTTSPLIPKVEVIKTPIEAKNGKGKLLGWEDILLFNNEFS